MTLIFLYIALSVSLFLVKSLYYQAAIATAVFLILIFMPFKKIKGGLFPIMLFLVFTFAGNIFFHSGRIIAGSGILSITDDGLLLAGIRTLRVFSMICSAKILTSRLPLNEMILAMNRILSPLERIGIPVRDFFYIMGLTVKALPVLSSHLAVSYMEDLKNKGIRGFRGRLRHLVSFIMPVFTESIKAPESFFVSEENGTGN